MSDQEENSPLLGTRRARENPGSNRPDGLRGGARRGARFRLLAALNALSLLEKYSEPTAKQ